MTDRINCPNCGAPVDMTADRCPYCGTPYLVAPQLIMDPQEVARMVTALDLGLITQNEARRRLGLREI